MQTALNSDYPKLPALFSELRFWITQRRCEKTLQHLPATPHQRLPLLHAPNHPITKISKHKVYIQFHRHPNVILVVELKEKDTNPNEMEYTFYLVYVKHTSIEADGKPQTEEAVLPENEIPKLYLKVLSVIEFDTFVATHGAGTHVYGKFSFQMALNLRSKLILILTLIFRF